MIPLCVPYLTGVAFLLSMADVHKIAKAIPGIVKIF